MTEQIKNSLIDSKNSLQLAIHHLYLAQNDFDSENCTDEEWNINADIESEIYQLDKHVVLINKIINN